MCDHILKLHQGEARGRLIRGRDRPRGRAARVAFDRIAFAQDEHLPSVAMPRARILVVDDDEFAVKVYRRILGEHELVIARDGEEALRLVRAAPRFDVILCDFHMPKIDGVQLSVPPRRRQPSAPDSSFAAAVQSPARLPSS
jgi:PleD family two-component response regulator